MNLLNFFLDLLENMPELKSHKTDFTIGFPQCSLMIQRRFQPLWSAEVFTLKKMKKVTRMGTYFMAPASLTVSARKIVINWLLNGI